MTILSGSKKSEEYYKQIYPNFYLTDLKFRHFRLRVSNCFIKIKKKIRTEQELKELLIQANPLDAFYSTSCFLSPELLGPKTISTPRFLKNDLVFDLDTNDQLKDLEDVRLETLKLLDFLKEKNIKQKYLAFSGSKGFHIVCENKKIEESDSETREKECEYYNKSIIEEIKENNILVDSKTTVDTRRIFRIPNTINSKTGYVCTVLSRRQLEQPISEVFKNMNRIYIPAPKIPFLGNECFFFEKRNIFGWLHRFGARSPPKYILSFINNRVPATSLSIIILKHPLSSSPEKLKKILSRAQGRYLLPDFYVFKHEDFFYSISFKPLQKERMIKILRSTNSLNLSQFLKYSLVYFPVGRKRSFSMKILSQEPVFEFTVLSERVCKLSRPHVEFFSNFGLGIDKENATIGRKCLNIKYCIFES